jgi:E3 ubiquitin-protein ligase NEDD4
MITDSPLSEDVPAYKQNFRRKLIYFRSLPVMKPQLGHCQITVRRDHIMEDSFNEVMKQTPDALKRKLYIKFDGEEGLDYGGVSR